jgi:hypothetical protein
VLVKGRYLGTTIDFNLIMYKVIQNRTDSFALLVEEESEIEIIRSDKDGNKLLVIDFEL